MTRLLLPALLSGLLLACAPQCTPEPTPAPGPTLDAGPTDDALPEEDATSEDPAAECHAAGEKICDLGCRAADGTPQCADSFGNTWASRCTEELTAGTDNWHPACVKIITDCANLDSAINGLWCVDGGAP